jgi:hypothetical protein
MPTIISGSSATNDVLAAGLVVDMDKRVFALDPPGNPYTRLVTKRIKSRPAKQTKVSWQEDDIVPFWDTANETIADNVLDFNVSNGTYFQAGDLVKNSATGEIFRVTIVATNNLTITRGYAGTTAAAITSGDWLINLRAAQAEGTTSPTARATLKVEKFNYTQILKTPVHITATNKAVAHYHGNELDYQTRKAGEEHARAWEEIALHGHAANDVATAATPIRTAGGLDDIIDTNILTVSGGVLTEPEFRDWAADCFRYRVNGSGGGTKMLFASRAMKLTMDSWGESKLIMNEKASATYGMDISTYIGSTGTLQVIYHPLLENGYEDTSYLVDPDGCMFRPLRPTKLHMDIEEDGEDGTKHEYRTEATFMFAQEKCFGKIDGVTY